MLDDDGPTFPQAPPERIELPQGLCLVRCDPERSAVAARAINESLDGGPCEGRPRQVWMVDRVDWAGDVPVAASP